jgi:hypothetical protein
LSGEEIYGKLKALSANLIELAEDKRDLEEKLERSTKLVNKYKNIQSQRRVLQQENIAFEQKRPHQKFSSLIESKGHSGYARS